MAMTSFNQSKHNEKPIKIRRFDETVFTDMLTVMSGILIKEFPAQDYNLTPALKDIVTLMARDTGLNNIDQLMSYRAKYSDLLKKRFGVEFATGLTAFGHDFEELLKQHNVPQNDRVFCGMLDTFITVVAKTYGTNKATKG
jgi:hypothetical protein